jgi:uncharacterized membrane protein YoaK (UPF0700 family)
MAHLPVDHPLRGLYRGAAFLTGVGLTAFGAVGYVRSASLPFLDQDGVRVFMLSTNRAFALLSIVVGLLVIAATLIGRNVDVPVNTGLGAVFMLSGLVMLCVLRTDLNYLAFSMTNVNVSFVIGLILMTAGLYGTMSRSRRVDASDIVDSEKASTH